MIPAPNVPELHLFGPFALQPFGTLVATGVLAGCMLIYRRAKKLGLPEVKAQGAMLSVLIPGFVGGHVVEILFYQTHRLQTEGLGVLLRIWDGLSSYGGFIGAMIGFLIYSARYLKKDTLIYADLLIQGLVLGWIFGRAGCTITFDHPGALSDFVLAFQHPRGARHNLGFYELLFTVFVLAPALFIVHRKKLKPGYSLAVVCLLYAPVRFGLDFLRATDLESSDTRYFGLTFAHYSSIALLIVAIVLLRRLKKVSASFSRSGAR